MFPFWDLVIKPIIDAAAATRIVEIGVRHGQTTIRMLEELGPGVEVHVVDPQPDFDPSEHGFAGRCVVHADTSHNVLPGLGPADVALVDGDHNWFTVYHELDLLRETSRRAGAPLPVLVLHDVAWPYGRRDLYYAPERIPSEFRQLYARGGVRPGRDELLPGGRGLNHDKFNALTEGGERNGVMTALDDFVAGHDRPLRQLVIPMYFGLAVVVEEERLARQPELASLMDWLETAEAKDRLLELGESVRIRGLLNQGAAVSERDRLLEQSASRYLELLKAALLDELYIENEVRIKYLTDCIERGRSLDLNQLRDPVRRLRDETARLQSARRTGTFEDGGTRGASLLPYTDMGRIRLDHLERCLDDLRASSISGDLVECGTGRGGGAIFMRGSLDAHHVAGARVWVVDTFRTETLGPSMLDLTGDLNVVRDGFERFGLLDDRVRFLQGPYADTLADAPVERIALLRLGRSLHGDSRAALDALYPAVAAGGIVIVDDYESAEGRAAVDGFRDDHRVGDPLERVDWSAAVWRKSASGPASSVVRPRPSGRALRAPLATTRPGAGTDLSIVVVFYNMRREAARTLHSLSRSYQQGIEALDYEVIVVENGSDDDQKLGDAFVRSFGSEFRYLDLGLDATPTPADALNRGAALASGEAIAFMIDGAHVLTPGVLEHGMVGMAGYAPAIVVTQQWYVGPGQQGDQMRTGYDQAYEDRLFRQIEWPSDGYRLFEVGHFIGDRDWFDGLWESNCIFVPRKLLEQVGCFDESFEMPGGGYANLDFYERMGCTPGVHVVTLLGEGSFHQLHGGTTTNRLDTDDRRQTIVSYGDHYAELRGRGFKGPGKRIHYVGSMSLSAKRTRARTMDAGTFRAARAPSRADGAPATPSPIPDELRTGFVDAFWHSLAWQETRWLGTRVEMAPTDLVAYQELVASVRPSWIVETGTGTGGRALFLASICDLVGDGRVVSIDDHLGTDLPRHPRITYVEGAAHDADTARRVKELVGPEPRALVVLGSCGTRDHTVAEFEAYRSLVPVGSYVVVADTIVNGHPVRPDFGPGPREAVKRIVAEHTEFAIDPKLEKYSLTFNPSGYLKRLR